MSPFTIHQPGGRRARVNERLFFIKRSLIERNNSRIGGGGPAPCAGERPRGPAAAPYPAAADRGGHRGPLAAMLRPSLKLYTGTWGNGQIIPAPARGLAMGTAVAKGRVPRGGGQDTRILQEGVLKGLLGGPEKQAPALRRVTPAGPAVAGGLGVTCD